MPSFIIPSFSKLGTIAHTDKAARLPCALPRSLVAPVGSPVTSRAASPLRSCVGPVTSQPETGNIALPRGSYVRSLSPTVRNLNATELHAELTCSADQPEAGPLSLRAKSAFSSQAIPDEGPNGFSVGLQVGTFGERVTPGFDGRELAHSSLVACLSPRSASNARLPPRFVPIAELPPPASPSRNVRKRQSCEVPPESVSNARLSLRSLSNARKSSSVSPSTNAQSVLACELAPQVVSNPMLSPRSVSRAEQPPPASPSRNGQKVHSCEVPPQSVSKAGQSSSVSPSRNAQSVPQVVSAPQVVSEQPPLRLVIFDFDCTLIVYHVFASLAGISTTNMTLPVPPPHARSERGQLVRLAELDADPVWGPAGFALRAFGGATRVAQLRNVLQLLAGKGVECIICSNGYVGPIRKCLDQVKLLTFFTEVFGNLGTSLGTSDYDKTAYAVVASNVLGHEGNANADVRVRGVVPKAEAIAKCVKERRLSFSQVAFLDDQIDEIKLAANVCRTTHVVDGNVCAAMSSLMACI